ncbi:MAG: hypothetical protein ACI9ES_000897 [Oceanospirillaceae bacterium]|jgi:hypothetical protein
MEAKEQKRLKELTNKGMFGNETAITMSDLLLLIKENVHVQQAIQQCVAAGLTSSSTALNGSSENNTVNKTVEVERIVEVEKIVERIVEVEIEKIVEVEKIVDRVVEVEKIVEKIVEKTVEKKIQLQDPIRAQLSRQFTLFDIIKNDASLLQLFNLNAPLAETEQGEFLLSWCAFVADFNNVCELWDHIANLCCEHKRAITETETHVLESTILQHNRSYVTSAVSLCSVKSGAAYNYEIHKQIITATGDVVATCCLAGLCDIENTIVRKPLVRTSNGIF